MAGGSTYQAIATTTLTSAVSSYSFSSIPSTYTDLVLICNTKMTSAADNMNLQVGNGTIDTGTNYSYRYLSGDGTSAVSGNNSNLVSTLSGRLGNVNSTNIVHFMNYSNTTTYKTIMSRGNDASTSGQVGAYVCLWRSTVAINIIKILEATGDTYAAGSTFTLYGIKAA